MLEITKNLVVSTAHIKWEDNELLSCESQPHLIVKHYPEGFFINVVGELDPSACLYYSEAFKNLLTLAKENGCTYLQLDGDGPLIEGLPTFEW